MDINEIFKDLGMMIHEQGDVIGKSCCCGPFTCHSFLNEEKVSLPFLV